MTIGKLVAGVAALAVVAVVFAVHSDLGRALMGRRGFTKSVTNDRSRFYLPIVNLACRGEPLGRGVRR
jgi:hypothetical protein